jgi:hypothetical protein
MGNLEEGHVAIFAALAIADVLATPLAIIIGHNNDDLMPPLVAAPNAQDQRQVVAGAV